MMDNRKIEGLQNTIQKLVREKAELQKENDQLKKELGIIEEIGFVEELSLPLIKFGSNGKPYCEKHGAMLAYKHNIYRCEACKTGVQIRKIERVNKMVEKEELYRFEIILYKDSAEFGINFPKPHPYLTLPNVHFSEEECFAEGLLIEGWRGKMSIISQKLMKYRLHKQRNVKSHESEPKEDLK